MSTPTHERLTICAMPRAQLAHIETQLALVPDAMQIERYVNTVGTVYEKHVRPNGVAVWYRVVKAVVI
jgi:hypothetical protein